MSLVLFLDPYAISPLPQGVCGQTCIECKAESANWTRFEHGSPVPWCAHCILTKTEWAVSNAAALADLFDKVGAEMGIELAPEGKLLPEHAERILHSIVLISRIRHRAGRK